MLKFYYKGSISLSKWLGLNNDNSVCGIEIVIFEFKLTN